MGPANNGLLPDIMEVIALIDVAIINFEVMSYSKISVTKICWKIMHLKLQLHFSGANELNQKEKTYIYIC